MIRFEMGERVLVSRESDRPFRITGYGIITWMASNETLFRVQLESGAIFFAIQGGRCKYDAICSYTIWKLEET